jgi:hypothetical protein
VRGARTISNALTIPGFAERHSDRLVTRVACGRIRQARTTALSTRSAGPADLMRLLRDHGEGREAARYSWFNGSLDTVCMHGGGGAVKGSVSTASWVSELTPENFRHWATGTAAPCCGVFKPVQVDQPVDVGLPSDTADADSLWWRHERLHRSVLRDPTRLLALFSDERGDIERRWIAEPPGSAAAFVEGNRLLAEWTRRVERERVTDTRPPWARRYWRTRSRRAGL